ncbi:Transposase DDE domain group 1 [Sporolactobacillus nakayamae]|uniref:Transposase DDE domain group 1 n=1 Tax=Sporolactobacillus nakayamae TaxID=269670 RepID=A0A1I2TFS3_9BACL|nr:Transposase DDE domain group 1 [Sporolactobacillus nakayamae]
MTGELLEAKLCPGNMYTSNGIVNFIQPLIKRSNDKFPETLLFLRGDSGFAIPDLYALCEKEPVYFVIHLKSNAQLQRLANEYHTATVPSDVSKTECYFEETIHQAKSVIEA